MVKLISWYRNDLQHLEIVYSHPFSFGERKFYYDALNARFFDTNIKRFVPKQFHRDLVKKVLYKEQLISDNERIIMPLRFNHKTQIDLETPEVKELKKKLSGLESQYEEAQELKAKLVSLEQKVKLEEDLKDKLQKQENELESLRVLREEKEELDRRLNHFSNTQEELEEEKREQLKYIETLNAKLKDFDGKEQDYKMEIIEVRSSLSRAEEQVDDYESKAKELDRLQKERENLIKKLEDQKDKENQIKCLQAQLSVLKDKPFEIEQLKRKLKGLESKPEEVANLKKKIKDLQSRPPKIKTVTKVQTVTKNEAQSSERFLTDQVIFVSPTLMKQAEFEKKGHLYETKKRLNEFDWRIHYENKEGLSVLYNRYITEENRDKIVVFVHDDVIIEDLFVDKKLVEAHKHFDVVGLAGTNKIDFNMPSPFLWHLVSDSDRLKNRQCQRGYVAHPTKDGKIAQTAFGVTPDKVMIVDGLFISCRVSALLDKQVFFDEDFRFHFYDMSFCLRAYRAGLKIGTWPIDVLHYGIGDSFYSHNFEEQEKIFRKKYGTL